jgi:hypothetical protein
MANPFFTIGHSTRPLVEFVDLLKGVDVLGAYLNLGSGPFHGASLRCTIHCRELLGPLEPPDSHFTDPLCQ